MTTDFALDARYATMPIVMEQNETDKVKLGRTHSWPVAGHLWAVQQLSRSVLAPDAKIGGLRHAYLFVGPRQVGKSTFTSAFAQALLCTANLPDGRRPCGTCRSCQLMARGAHPDFYRVQPTRRPRESERNAPLVVDRLDGSLRAEQAADIVRDAALRPVEGRYKVFHIQDAHQANPAFANKLLKTLEEPPPHVVICLTALDRASLLPTIVSRCQVMELRPLDAGSVERALLECWQAEPTQAHLLARLANGRLGWAVEQLHSKRSLATRQEQLDQLVALMRSDRLGRLAFAERLATNSSGADIFSLLEFWASWLRDIMLMQAGCPESCANIDQMETITVQARSLSSQSVQDFMRTIQKVNDLLHHTVNARLALDVLLLRLPQAPG